MRHLRYITCHPSRIGLFHKDHPLVILLFFLLFSSILLGTIALKVFNTNYFSNGDIDYVQSTVVKYDSTLNIEYKDYKITGESVLIKKSPLELRILPTESKVDNNGLIMLLGTESAEIYYSYIKIGSVKYSDIPNNYSFTLAGVKSGDSASTYNFRCFMDYMFTKSNTGYAVNVFVNETLNVLFYYFIFAIIAILVYSFFANSQISFGIRAKLVIYDSLIYFVIMFFTIAFDISFLQYVAIFLPAIFCNLTFTHIIKVRK